MLHEIEAVEREISGCEDRILGEMERADELTAEVRREETAFEEATASHAERTAELAAAEARLEQECRRLEEQRSEVASGLSEELRERFARVAKLRGAAVSEARDGVCSQCRVKLRPQLFVEVKRNDAIRQCDYCSRILFYAPIEEVAPLP
jgi:predicted  nucleic acid-binding Zn-ribbon protein